jgi:hypothetical protein
VLKELKDLGERLDIKPLIRGYVQSLGAIHQETRKSMEGPVQHAESVFRSAMELYRSAEPRTEELSALAAVIKGRGDKGAIQLFEDFMKYRARLQKKNRSLGNLVKAYASSEVVSVN